MIIDPPDPVFIDPKDAGVNDKPALVRQSREFPPDETSAQIPSLLHTFLFFVLAVMVLLIGELITVSVGRQLPAFRHEDFATLAGDARLMIPSQAIQYAVLLGCAAWLFSTMWGRPFWRALDWNAAAVRSKGLWLAGLGVLLGLGTSLAGNYLPMPKEAPILNDLMHSATGAWLMFLFGTTGAPFIEELAFRGFLLPSLLNAFRKGSRHTPGAKAASGDAPLHALDVVLGKTDRPGLMATSASILLTSLPFALLHSLQVSYAWAPVLLIGVVSVALCLVRIVTNSLAASTFVHATYNFSLFATMLVASDGFRHLEKLNN